jgi:SprT protein
MFSRPRQLSLDFSVAPSAFDRNRCARDAMAEARAILPLRRPARVRWRNYTSSAGKAYFEESCIGLSKKLLNTEERLRETLLHEWAHLFVFERYGHAAKPHGPEWKAAMRKLGLRPIVTHDFDLEWADLDKPYVCTCAKCGYQFGRARPLKRGYGYTHIGCGGKIRCSLRPERVQLPSK